jgi:hypothetical protein
LLPVNVFGDAGVVSGCEIRATLTAGRALKNVASPWERIRVRGRNWEAEYEAARRLTKAIEVASPPDASMIAGIDWPFGQSHSAPQLVNGAPSLSENSPQLPQTGGLQNVG